MSRFDMGKNSRTVARPRRVIEIMECHHHSHQTRLFGLINYGPHKLTEEKCFACTVPFIAGCHDVLAMISILFVVETFVNLKKVFCNNNLVNVLKFCAE